MLRELGYSDFQTGKTKLFIRSSRTLFELQAQKAKFLKTAGEVVPASEQLIFADKVTGYDQGVACECLLVLTGDALRLMRGKR